MKYLLVPENVNPFSEELENFCVSAGLTVKDPESVFQYLTEFTYGKCLKKGERVFLWVNTYDRHPEQRFVIGYHLGHIPEEKPVKEYVIKEYRHIK